MKESNNWFLDELERRGVSRREFMGFCGVMASALALPRTAGARILAEIEKTEKPVLVWLEFQDCAGNTESLLRASRPTVAEIVLDTLSIDYHETIMAAAGTQAEDALKKTVQDHKGKYLAVVEGSIPTGADGAYCTIGGRSALADRPRGLRRRPGDDRHGNLRDLRRASRRRAQPDGRARRLRRRARRQEPDQPLGLSGQRREPHGAHRLLPHVQALAAARSLPPAALRLRQGDPRQLRAARPLRRRPVRRGLGRRRRTASATASTRWAARARSRTRTARASAGTRSTNWPIGCGHPCIGCAEPDFWDKMTPFYQHLSGIPGLRRGLQHRPRRGLGHRRRRRGLRGARPRLARETVEGGAAGPAPAGGDRQGDAARKETGHDARRRRSRHPNRGAPADRGRGRPGEGQGRLVLRDDVPRHRADPEGPRPARRLGLHPAHLRRVHDGARDRLHPRRRERRRSGPAAQRPPAAQPDHRVAVRAGPRHPLLPPARARLGGHRLRPFGRSREDLGAGAVDLRLAALERDVLHRRPATRQGLRRTRAARPLRQRLLGPSRLPAARRGEPDGRGPLPRGARLAAGIHQDPRGPGRKEPAPPELPRGRHGDADRSRPPGLVERGDDRPAARPDREGARLRHARLHPGSPRRRLFLQGLGGLRRAASATTSSTANTPRRRARTRASSSPRG